MPTKEELIQTLPQTGELAWISYRPAKDQPVREAESILVDPERGLDGDHYQGQSGKRQVTLFQEEHLPVYRFRKGLGFAKPFHASIYSTRSGLDSKPLRCRYNCEHAWCDTD